MGTVQDISLFFCFSPWKNHTYGIVIHDILEKSSIENNYQFEHHPQVFNCDLLTGDSTGQFLNNQPTITFSPQCRNLIFRNNAFLFFFIHFNLNVFIRNCDETVVILGEKFAKLVLIWNSMWWNYWIESEGHTSDNFFAYKIFIII